MTDEPGVHDFSRLDAHLASVRRTALLHASWRPMLAGAVGAGLMIAAVALAAPRFAYREIEVPKISYRDAVVPNIVEHDVPVDHVVPHDVPVEIPRLVPSPLARTPEERSFTSTDDWRASDIRGRITRAVDNGFALQTETQGELEFDPAKIGPDGKVEPNPLVKDVVTGLVGDLAYCRPRPTGVFNCVALHNGREVAIAQAPVGRPL